jgi:hypothetical protein
MAKLLLVLSSLLIMVTACTTVPKEELNYKPYYLCIDNTTGEMWSARITTQDNQVAEVSLKTLTKNQGILSLSEVHKSHYRIEATSREEGVIYVALTEIDNTLIQYKNLSCQKDKL